MDRNCLKTVYGESVLTQIAKIKMTGSIILPVGKKIKKKKIKITGSIIGPAMAGPTGPSATALIRGCSRRGRFLLNIAELSFGCEISRCPAFFENGIIIIFVADYSTCLPRNATN